MDISVGSSFMTLSGPTLQTACERVVRRNKVRSSCSLTLSSHADQHDMLTSSQVRAELLACVFRYFDRSILL